jgi:hypothetical protein
MGGLESGHSASTTVAVTTIAIDVTSLSETLSWLSSNAVNSTHYALSLTRDETISPKTLSYLGKTDITISLKGKGEERIVSLSGNGSLFTIAEGVTLILDDHITLKGHGSNTASLVQVNPDGNLILKDGAKISGNTAASSGGEVYVTDSTFTKQVGGIIYGSNATSALANTTTNGGAAVYVYVNSSSNRLRNTTAGIGVTLDSMKDGSVGGWLGITKRCLAPIHSCELNLIARMN